MSEYQLGPATLTDLYQPQSFNATPSSDSNLTKSTENATDEGSSIFSYSSSTHIQEVALAGMLSIVVVVTVVGNTLVITAVLTTPRLRTITNCFVMSLAVADWLVGVFVMPPAVAYRLMGVWELGWLFCDIWISLDILLCTASILSLCAISVDRYLAVTQPLTYSRKRRSKRLALVMIGIVWLSSALITCPPMLGWYEQDRHISKTCLYNKNTGYVIFSAMGSFFIPMVVMLYVYMRISCVVAQRHDQLVNLEDKSVRGTSKVIMKTNTDGIMIAKQVCDGESDSDLIERASYEHHHQDAEQCVVTSQKEPHESNRSSKANISAKVSANSCQDQFLQTPELLRSVSSSPNSSTNHRTSFLSRTRSLVGANSINLNDPHHSSCVSSHRVSSLRRETKTAQTLSIVVGGFIACWLPFFVYYLLTPFLPSEDSASKDKLNLIMAYLTWLGWINSAINPFIYAFYSPDFRIAFARLTVKRFKRKNQQQSQHLT